MCFLLGPPPHFNKNDFSHLNLPSGGEVLLGLGTGMGTGLDLLCLNPEDLLLGINPDEDEGTFLGQLKISESGL